jgi:hypothetical protein
MSNTGDINEKDIEDELSERQIISEQVSVYQQLLRLQSDIERQGDQVTGAINQIVETIDNDRNIPPEMMNHLKAQILLAHLQLDELRESLDLID